MRNSDLDIESSLEEVAVERYLVLTAVLRHLNSLLQELDPDIVGLREGRTGPEHHVLGGGQHLVLLLQVEGEETQPGGPGGVPGGHHLLGSEGFSQAQRTSGLALSYEVIKTQLKVFLAFHCVFMAYGRL